MTSKTVCVTLTFRHRHLNKATNTVKMQVVYSQNPWCHHWPNKNKTKTHILQVPMESVKNLVPNLSNSCFFQFLHNIHLSHVLPYSVCQLPWLIAHLINQSSFYRNNTVNPCQARNMLLNGEKNQNSTTIFTFQMQRWWWLRPSLISGFLSFRIFILNTSQWLFLIAYLLRFS